MIVRVPATSANLGPGFDCMGIAWQLYDEILFERSDELVIDGCDPRYQGRNNLAYLSFTAALKACGKDELPVRISFLNTDIPISRGLGSSAALLVAGAYAADQMFSLGLGKEGVNRIACRLEGHPDNITPAVFGNLQLVSMSDDTVARAGTEVSDIWRFCVLIPDFELSTAEARKALPDLYSRSEAVFNISRAGLLVKALESGDAELLRYAQADVIHQPYRLPLITGYEKAFEAAKNAGAVSACISGAGPTLLCTFIDIKAVSAMKELIAESLPSWKCVAVSPDEQGIILLA
ncbi:MAG: homoserine kinase [Oscillospiraceae bacterium]|nr:homoserine kinase [Oscillospiraceae bacterium]